MITTIATRNFIISDKKVLDEIKRLELKYVFVDVKRDYDNEIIVTVGTVPSILGKASRYCSKIFFGTKVSIRTPKFLVGFVGKKAHHYRDVSVFKDTDELFRIRPINFKIKSEKLKAIDLKADPYFTASGVMVIPKMFINSNFKHKYSVYKVSFDATDLSILSRGVIRARMIPVGEEAGMCFKIKESDTYVSTGVLTKIKKLVSDAGKEISSFQFKHIEFNEYYENGIITFTESQNG